MESILLYDFSWVLRTILLLSLAFACSYKFLPRNFKILGGILVLGSYFCFLLYFYPSKIYLESPSQTQQAYQLKYNNNSTVGKVFTSFSSKSLKFYQKMNSNSSELSLRLLNEDYCLLITWSDTPLEINKIINDSFAQRIIVPVADTTDVCPKNISILNFNLSQFKYEFKRESSTSAKHIYYLN